jgi:hypothetical protein
MFALFRECITGLFCYPISAVTLATVLDIDIQGYLLSICDDIDRDPKRYSTLIPRDIRQPKIIPKRFYLDS